MLPYLVMHAASLFPCGSGSPDCTGSAMVFLSAAAYGGRIPIN